MGYITQNGYSMNTTLKAEIWFIAKIFLKPHNIFLSFFEYTMWNFNLIYLLSNSIGLVAEQWWHKDFFLTYITTRPLAQVFMANGSTAWRCTTFHIKHCQKINNHAWIKRNKSNCFSTENNDGTQQVSQTKQSHWWIQMSSLCLIFRGKGWVHSQAFFSLPFLFFISLTK